MAAALYNRRASHRPRQVRDVQASSIGADRIGDLAPASRAAGVVADDSAGSGRSRRLPDPSISSRRSSHRWGPVGFRADVHAIEYEATITVDLSRQGAQVTMSVLLDTMHDEATTAMQEEGFTSQLTRLDRRFARG